MLKQLWLPSFFSSGMILQQQVVNQMRGHTRPAASVSLTLERRPFDNRSVSPLDNQYGLVGSSRTDSDGNGDFSLEIPRFEASFDPFTLTVTDGTETMIFKDVLFGEVWITAGQSNMQMPLSACATSQQMQTLANLYYIRVLSQSTAGLAGKNDVYSFRPHNDLAGAAWLRGDQPDAIAGVSAIGFSYARELHIDLKVPVGLIETALRGTHIHTWLSRESVESNADIRQHIEGLGCYRDEKDWNLTGDRAWACHQPAALFNSKIAPLQGLGARGIVWHHGESDYQYPDYYQKALKVLVKDWQKIFLSPDTRGLAFLAVQLKPHFHGHYRFEQLAEFNEMLAAVRHALPGPAALVPIYDLPLDFTPAPPEWQSPGHAISKLPIGVRLKTVALGLLYQRKAPSSAPECDDIEIVGGKMMLSFTNIGDGLRISGDDSRLRGFAICGPDRIFLEAQARILYGLKVLVWHEQVSNPQAVTYAYADLNQHANLVSRDHLPVVPFRSDREPSRYSPPHEWTHCENLKLWCCPRYDRPDETGWYPAWQVERGHGDILLDKANKSEGDAALFFRYQQNGTHEYGLEPLLHYDSLFPPLDLSAFSLIALDIFNPDQQLKHLRLAVASGPADAQLQPLPTRITVLPALRWQRMQFDLGSLPEESRAAIRRLVFLIEDRKEKGSVYLDNIRFVR